MQALKHERRKMSLQIVLASDAEQSMLLSVPWTGQAQAWQVPFYYHLSHGTSVKATRLRADKPAWHTQALRWAHTFSRARGGTWLLSYKHLHPSHVNKHSGVIHPAPRPTVQQVGWSYPKPRWTETCCNISCRTVFLSLREQDKLQTQQPYHTRQLTLQLS